MLTLARFIELLPQFAVVEATKVTPAIPLVHAMNNGFAGIEDAVTREYALALATADYVLKHESNTASLFASQALTGNAGAGNPVGIKKEKSYDDEIEYFDVNASQLLATDYAGLLEELLMALNPFGFGIGGHIHRCGC